jgi:hypothetical protein
MKIILRCLVFLALLILTPLIAPMVMAQDAAYFDSGLSALFTYNQYAPTGTLPVGLSGSFDKLLGNSVYSISAVDITAQPIASPDGTFKMPLLVFTGRTGLKYYVPTGSKVLHPYLLGDVGLAGSARWTLGNYAGGGGMDFQFKPSWAIPVEFRAIGRSGQETNYLISFGFKYLLKKLP